jgi:N-acetylglucosaminyldiphosphoundecaprenol N-acetyl-beta-D-mannosaminyltransferase
VDRRIRPLADRHAELSSASVWNDDNVQRLQVGPVPIDFCEPEAAWDAIATRQIRGAVHLCNAYTIALADERADLAAALNAECINFPDGMPLVWWARRHQISVSNRVYGPDLMEAVLARGRIHGLRHYLYGSTPEVLDGLVAAIGQRWPEAEIVGTESPPFRELTDHEVAESVRRAGDLGADVVWVGMGTPKQDLLTHRMARLGNGTYVAIGAAFDFIAGTKSQAPAWMQHSGLEWLYRLVTEPKRLWKRYLIYNVKFVRILWQSRSSIRD